MHNEFTAVFERDGDWFIGYCPEIAGANGQGHSLEQCQSKKRITPSPFRPWVCGSCFEKCNMKS